MGVTRALRRSALNCSVAASLILGQGCGTEPGDRIVGPPVGRGTPAGLVRVSIAPETAHLDFGGTLAFVAWGHFANGDSATLRNVAYSATGGSIDSDGVYTAGGSPGTFGVLATAEDLAIADTSLVTISTSANSLLRLMMIPAAITLAPGDSQQFRVEAAWSDGSSSFPTVAFSASGGTITAEGLYTSGLTPGEYHVRAAYSGGGGTDSVNASVAVASRSATRRYGLHMDITYFEDSVFRAAVIRHAQELHARVGRNSLAWYSIEPTKGVRDWRTHDGAINEIVAAGIEPLLVVLTSPAWANGAPDQWFVPTTESAFQTWLGEYRQFLTAAALRYKDRVHMWELWSEENERYTWKPVPNIDQYVRFYQMAYAAIKAVDPTAQVSVGGLTGLAAGCCIYGDAFLQALYDRGIRPDIVNIHPYAGQQQPPDVTLPYQPSFTDISLIHDVMVRNGEGAKPIWVTEWGWTTNPANEQVIAGYINQSLHMIDTLYPYVTVATYFMEVDMVGFTHGLYRSDWTAKPGAAAFADFAGRH